MGWRRYFDQNSEAKAAKMEGLFPINDPTNVPKVLDMARDGYGSFVIETVLFLCVLEKLHEEWVFEIHEWHHEPFLLFSLPHFYCQTPFGHSPLVKTLLRPTSTHHCKLNSLVNLCVRFSIEGNLDQKSQRYEGVFGFSKQGVTDEYLRDFGALVMA